MKYLRKFAFVLFMIVILQLVSVRDIVRGSQTNLLPTDTLLTELDESETPEEEAIQAIVVVNSSSGKSYVADRDYIATMPALTTEEEVANFIKTYESSAEDRELVRQGFEQAGFNIVAQDNLFLIVSGSPSTFQTILPNFSQQTNSTSGNSSEIFSGRSISISSEIRDLVDGIIIPQESVETNNLNEVTYNLIDIPLSTVSGSTIQGLNADYDDVLKALRLDKAHQQGFLGKGVRVGFYDTGVYFGHGFFREHPTDIKFFKFVDGKITKVKSNCDQSDPHGTQVASFLINSAPQAQFYSFAKGADKKDEPSNDELLSYLVYINSSHLVDIFSLSRGINEEFPYVLIGDYMAEIRMEFINFINDKGLVFVAGGNANECTLVYCSGHNWYASYPEVISVGGSEIYFQAASRYYLSASSNAVSFSSIRYTNPVRNVPDVVSLYGPLQVPLLSGGYKYLGGTSFSTPQIAGMAALLKATMPNLSQYQLKEILFNSSFDITLGSSADGDTALVGYDRATGYGQPIATDMLQDRQQLYPGWNLIGLTTTYDYTGESLLRYVQRFYGECDALSVYDVNQQAYNYLIIDEEGFVYGFDFDVKPQDAIWIRCQDKTSWTRQGLYVDSTLPIFLSHGWTGISIPYSTHTCSAKELLTETNGVCTKIARYDGQFQSFIIDNASEYGTNFALIPGEGYMVLCNGNLTWTPNCEDAEPLSNDVGTPSTNNLFTELANRQAEDPITNTLSSVSEESPNAMACDIYDRFLTNISGNTFSVIWTTGNPCPGYLIVNEGGGTGMVAYDDRGMNYSGTSHHVTIRGLSPLTTYNYQIISGTTSSLWSQATTGSNLGYELRGNNLSGVVYGANGVRFPGAIAYAWLSDDNNNASSIISIPIDEKNDGFSIVLGNARTYDLSAYFDLGKAKTLVLTFRAGRMGSYKQILIQDPFNSTPNIDIGSIILDSIPEVPQLQQPFSSTMDFSPEFLFSTTGAEVLKYRIELSRDNFNTIDYAFNQTQGDGWSSPSYPDGWTAQFMIPYKLENLTTYYWRVFAYDVNNESWSGASKIGAFSVNKFFQYIPAIRK